MSSTLSRSVQKPNPKVQNKTKVLFVTTRGVTTRFRHLMEDLLKLLPHAKKEPKLDTKQELHAATEVAELRSCDTVLLFESRKRQDLYLWISKSPFGPSIKFHVANLHTMQELSFPGNNLMFSRPLITFDAQFNRSPILQLMKELLTQVFCSPAGHRKTKPFVDHVISFSIVDGRIWFRHYQIVDTALNDKVIDKSPESTLVEIGPRFVLAPIKCYSGAFKGAVLWENCSYISPNEIRRAQRKREVEMKDERISSKKRRVEHLEQNPINYDDVHKVFR